MRELETFRLELDECYLTVGGVGVISTLKITGFEVVEAVQWVASRFGAKPVLGREPDRIGWKIYASTVVPEGWEPTEGSSEGVPVVVDAEGLGDLAVPFPIRGTHQGGHMGGHALVDKADRFAVVMRALALLPPEGLDAWCRGGVPGLFWWLDENDPDHVAMSVIESTSSPWEIRA